MSVAEPAHPEYHRAYIGLGSNLDQPIAQLQDALQALIQLPQTQLIAVSPFFGSRAVGPGQQPDYVNAVAGVDTQLSPQALLDALQTIENQQGRQRGSERWIARTLDLDLLLYDAVTLDTPDLIVPHPRMHERAFVLCPLALIAPAFQLAASALDTSELWRL